MTPGDGVELLGTESGPHEVHETVSLGPRRPGRLVLATAAGVLLFGIGLWVFGGAGDRSRGPDEAAGPAAPGDDDPVAEPESPADSTTTSETTTSAADSATTSEATTTTRPRPTTTVTTQVVGDGSPLLGRPSGWSLVMGDGNRMHRLDLDTGELRRLSLWGSPEAVSGSWLVVGGDGTTATAVPLADPDSDDQIELRWSGYYVAGVTAHPEPGLLWVAMWPNSGPSMVHRLVDLDEGGVTIREIEIAAPSYFAGFGPGINDEIREAPAGGVFVPAGNGYTRVSDGRLVAVSTDWALVQTCVDPDRCQLGWLSRNTWETVARPVPDIDPIFANVVWLSPDGRVLAHADQNYAGVTLFDVSRGREVAAYPVDDTGYGGAMVVSADGRYVAIPGDGWIDVYDVDDGAMIKLGVDTSNGRTRVVFVPSDA